MSKIITTKEEFVALKKGTEVEVFLSIDLPSKEKIVNGPVFENNTLIEELMINTNDNKTVSIKYDQIKSIEVFG